MPRFALKDLLLSITCLGIGMGLVAVLFRAKDHPAAWWFAMFGIGPLIGAGLMAPFGRPLAGAAVTVLMQIAFLLALQIYMYLHVFY
jgi:hypothetical protein